MPFVGCRAEELERAGRVGYLGIESGAVLAVQQTVHLEAGHKKNEMISGNMMFDPLVYAQRQDCDSFVCESAVTDQSRRFSWRTVKTSPCRQA